MHMGLYYVHPRLVKISIAWVIKKTIYGLKNAVSVGKCVFLSHQYNVFVFFFKLVLSESVFSDVSIAEYPLIQENYH